MDIRRHASQDQQDSFQHSGKMPMRDGQRIFEYARQGKKSQSVQLRKVVAVITCKDRLHHLKQTIPVISNLKCLGVDFNVLVVDYDSPDKCFDWCTANRIACLKVMGLNYAYFSPAKARNIGARYTKSDIICFMDADVIINENWFSVIMERFRDGCGLVTIDEFKTTCMGTCAVLRSTFDRVKGYDEDFAGWGNEDLDFVERCRHVCKEGHYSKNLIETIQHSDYDRIKHFLIKDHSKALARSQDYLTRRRGEINKNGFGEIKGPCVVNDSFKAISTDSFQHTGLTKLKRFMFYGSDSNYFDYTMISMKSFLEYNTIGRASCRERV